MNVIQGIGEREARFFVPFIDAYYTNERDTPNVLGSWSAPSGATIELEATESGIKGHWTQGKVARSLAGRLTNRAAVMRSKRKAEQTSLLSPFGEEDRTCYLFVEDNGARLHLLVAGTEPLELLEFDRVVEHGD